jgi:tetratricopeptide (TPR) repeat protein
MRRVGVVIFVLAATALHVEAGASTSIAQPDAHPWLSRLASYLQHVREHKPGTLDMAARLTGFMGEADLADLRADLFALVTLCKRELGRSVRPHSIVHRDTLVQFSDVRETLGLTDQEAAQGNANRILKRAAVLHADVAMLVIPFVPGRIGCSAVASLLVRDGNRIGMGCVGIHWIHGRHLLAAVGPDPAKDELVRRWYVAAATYLLEAGNYADAKPHLEAARLPFRADAEMLFARGYYHEAFASPSIQTVAAEGGSDLRGAKWHLEEAEDLYRRAVRENPQYVEARVRHGNVLALLGRHQDAVEELRLAAAAAAAQGTQLRYYAELFLGHAEESTGNASAARDHYRQASTLFPKAQSPLLALALLARQLGDRAGAQDAMRRVLALPAGRDVADDPWSQYGRWQDRDFKVRFTALHSLLLSEETP